MYQISAQNWSFVVLNSLAKVNQNEVITFERLKISLKHFMGPLGLGQRPGKPLRLVSKTNPLWVFFSMGRCFRLKHAEHIAVCTHWARLVSNMDHRSPHLRALGAHFHQFQGGGREESVHSAQGQVGEHSVLGRDLQHLQLE